MKLLHPQISLKRKSLVLPKLTLIVLLFYILFYSHFINIANYSFLMYSFGGFRVSNPIFDIIKYSRLPVLLIAAFAIILRLSHYKSLTSFYLKNIDLILFNVIMYFGLVNSLDKINGLFYTVWHTASFLTILTFLYLLRQQFSEKNQLLIFFRLIFWSNAIVLPLLFINLHTFGNGWTYEMAFSSKTFFPYCLLSMMQSLYGAQLFCNRSLFSLKSKMITKYLEIFLIVSMILFCFFSARRSPLFVMLLMSFIYAFYIVGKRLWKKVFLVLMVVAGLVYTIPKALSYIEQNKYELSILKKLNDLQQSDSGLKGDGSYNERLIVWEIYAQVSDMVPFFGTGSYNSTLYSMKYFGHIQQAGYSTHNLYRGILVEHGYVGLLLFMIVLLRGMFILFLKKSRSFYIKYFVFLILPVLGINWNEYNLIPGQVFYWTTILVLLYPRLFLLKSRK